MQGSARPPQLGPARSDGHRSVTQSLPLLMEEAVLSKARRCFALAAAVQPACSCVCVTLHSWIFSEQSGLRRAVLLVGNGTGTGCSGWSMTIIRSLPGGKGAEYSRNHVLYGLLSILQLRCNTISCSLLNSYPFRYTKHSDLHVVLLAWF